MTRNDTATTLRIVNPKIASPAAVAAGLRPSTVSVNAAIQAIGRNPDVAGQAQLNMFLGIAFTEALAIFALVVALLIGFKIL